MNSTDKKLLIGIAIIGAAGALYMRDRAKHNFPIKIFGLDPSNSQKFVLAITVLAGGILIYNHFIVKTV